MLQPRCTVIVHDNWRSGNGESLAMDDSQGTAHVVNNLLSPSTHSVTSRNKKIKFSEDFQPWYGSSSAYAALAYKSKAPVIALSSVNLWCSSQAQNSTRNLCKEFPSICSTFKKVDIEEMKSRWKISSRQRGKWVITQESLEAQQGNDMNLSKAWKKICSYIQAGNLPHANAVYKIRCKQICVFCDVKHSYKVWKTLRFGLGNIGSIAFEVHPHGPIMTL